MAIVLQLQLYYSISRNI